MPATKADMDLATDGAARDLEIPVKRNIRALLNDNFSKGEIRRVLNYAINDIIDDLYDILRKG